MSRTGNAYNIHFRTVYILYTLSIQNTVYTIQYTFCVPGMARIAHCYTLPNNIHFSQKQLPRKTKTRLVIIECAGYIFWQLLFMRGIVIVSPLQILPDQHKHKAQFKRKTVYVNPRTFHDKATCNSSGDYCSLYNQKEILIITNDFSWCTFDV